MLIRVFDTETTGIPSDDDQHALVQVGWCDVVDGVVGLPTQVMVNPGRPIPHAASAVHHIVDADVRDCPSPDYALRRLMDGDPDLFVAHNADFDRQFVGCGGRPIICTYKVALRFWPEAESHSNSYLRYFLGVGLIRELAEPSHHAGPDAYVTAHILVRILREAEARGVSIDEMVRWSKGPALHVIVNFGKHKGSRWDDLPSDYLRWIVEKSDLDRDTKANAKHRLRTRGEMR